MNINQEEAARFLAAIDADAESFSFQIFDDNKERKDKTLAKTFHGVFEFYADALSTYNERGAGIFVTINETDLGGRRVKNVKRVRACFIDLDGSPLQPVLADADIPQPHIIVETSPSRWHCYWLISGLPLIDFEWAQRVLAAKFNADPKICDLSRVMRLPGFWHQKTQPSQVRIQSLEQGLPIKGDVWMELLGRIAPPQAKKPSAAIAQPEQHSGSSQQLNQVALTRLSEWVTKIFPDAIESSGGYRITSEMLGRDLEEDLSIMPEGIKDFGLHDMGDEREGKRTALDIVMQHLNINLFDAVSWLRKTLGMKDVIVMRPGEMVNIVAKAQNALISAGVPIFERGGELVMPVRFGGESCGVVREKDSVILADVRATWLLKKMAEVIRWAKMTKSSKTAKSKLIDADPDIKYAGLILESKDDWKFPHLHGVITAPTLDVTGNIIETPGYHEPTGLLLDYNAGEFEPVPANPTQDDALRAMANLANPFRKFPFVDEASRAVALSALLCVVVRRSLRSVPLHVFDAPTAGTGKSIAAESVGVLINGVKPPSMSQGKSEEEDEKRLSVVLHAGDNVILLDNCERELRGDFLCSMLTQQRVQARILGQSERRVLPTSALVLATGNNIQFHGDVSRRAVKCRMDAQIERPDQREFDFDVLEEIKENRKRLIVDALTVLRAYHLAGRPGKPTPMGSFSDYAWVRGALVWLGYADPADTREEILSQDLQRNDLSEIMEIWFTAYGTNEVTVAEIGRVNGGATDDQISLRTRLMEVTGRKEWSSRSIGWWLKRHSHRVVAGRAITSESRGNMQKWRIALTVKGVSPDGGEDLPF